MAKTAALHGQTPSSGPLWYVWNLLCTVSSVNFPRLMMQKSEKNGAAKILMKMRMNKLIKRSPLGMARACRFFNCG